MKKKANRNPNNDLRPEYDFVSMKGGVRGKYAQRFREGTNIVLLQPEIAAAFPNEAAVNEALRGILKITQYVRSSGDLAERSRKRTSSSKRSG